MDETSRRDPPTEPRLDAAPALSEDAPGFDRFARAAYEAWCRYGHAGRPPRPWDEIHAIQRERWRIVARTIFVEASR